MSADYILLLPIGYVLLACICRLDSMTPTTSGVLWRVAYVALAYWTGAVAADLASTGAVPFRDALGVVAMALYMHLTKDRWREGVPEVARKHQGA